MSFTFRDNYFESKEFFEFALHTLSFVQVSLYTLGAYIIIMKTPNEMRKMKIPMRLMLLTFASYDVWALLVLPIMVFPICSGNSIGVLPSIGMPIWIQGYIGLTLLFLFGPAVTMFFENRYNYLVHLDCDTHSRRFKRAVHYFIDYFIALNAFVPAFLSMPDQSVARQIALQKLPCLPLEKVNHPTFLMVGSEYLNFVCIGSFAIFSWAQTFFFFAKTVNFIFGIKSRSQRFTQLQREFFIAVCIQVALPFVVIMTPACYILLTIYTNHFDEAFSNVSEIMISSHGLFSTITMLLIHKSYRTETLKILGIKSFYKSNKVAVVGMSPSATHNGLFPE